MTPFIQFIKTKLFFKHFSIALITVITLFLIIFKLLGNYTLHNETIVVPEFKGLKISELDNFIENKTLTYLIIDSVYDIKLPKGTVIKQDPEASTKVKANRTIYLYVTSILPPQIEMPKLEDKSLRQALAMIESYGLKAGKINAIADQCNNCVLQQLFKKEKINPGTLIEKGSIIDLIIGKGLGEDSSEIPCLLGLTKAEAISKLAAYFLNAGEINFEQITDSSTAKIYKQSPSCSTSNNIETGSKIDLFFTNNASKIAAIIADTITK